MPGEADSGAGCDRPRVVVEDEAQALNMTLTDRSADKACMPKWRAIWQTFYDVAATADIRAAKKVSSSAGRSMCSVGEAVARQTAARRMCSNPSR